MNMTNREKAKLMYIQGLGITDIAKTLEENVSTVSNWKNRDGWSRSAIFENIELAMQARLMHIIKKPKKSNADYKEYEEHMRQMERLAKIKRYRESGNGADLNPRLSRRTTKDRKKQPPNLITEEQIEALEEAFKLLLYVFQKEWVDVLDGTAKHKPARNFLMLKSRQIGATFIIALWALINGLKTAKNKIFLSASKAQAYQFIEYIKNFVFEVIDVQLKGDPMVITREDNKQFTLYYMGTNALTAQGRHGDVIMDEFFWVRNFEEFKKVASAMASQKQYQRIYLSTPSSILHPAYKFWAGKDNARIDTEIDVSHKALATPKYCKDRKWRQIITIKDAVAKGYDKFDLDELFFEYSDDEISNLFMCEFVDDSASFFPLSIIMPNMIDSWEVWKDFKPQGSKPYQGEVWVGYDPSFTGDYPALAVIAPPQKPFEPYRVLLRKRLDHKPPHLQALVIKKIVERYNVTFMGIDTTGAGISLAGYVEKFYPNYTPLVYNVELKTRMAWRVKDLFIKRKLHFDAGLSDVAKAFIAIKNQITGSGKRMTFVSSRSKEVGHADVAWAIMNALEKAPIANTDQVKDSTQQQRISVSG